MFTKQTILLFLLILSLLLLSSCRDSEQAKDKDANECQNEGTLLACNTSDTTLQISSFAQNRKQVFVLPSHWSLDSIILSRKKGSLKNEESPVFSNDTNIIAAHSHLPSLFINMDESEKDSIFKRKSYVAEASIALFLQDGTSEYEGEISIKTRGNSSWYNKEKKPFTIKLPGAARILNLEKGKSFTLVTNITDNSFICNALAFDMAKAMGLLAPTFNYVSLYLNGDYKGIYQMSNKIDVNRRSVNIVDLEKENKFVNNRRLSEYPRFSIGEPRMKGHMKGVNIKNPEDFTGGYLLDNSGQNWQYYSSISGFVSDAGDPIRIKSPKYASFEQVNYISNFYNEMEAAVMSSSGYHETTGNYYTEYLDIASFARYFLLQEITLNPDGGVFSFLMYKDAGDTSKMHAGPAWDFDRGLRKYDSNIVPFNILLTSTKTQSLEKAPYSGGLFYWLWQHNDFREETIRTFIDEMYEYIIDSCEWQNQADSLISLLYQDAEFDRMRYHDSCKNYTEEYRHKAVKTKEFLIDRGNFLYWLWTTHSADIVKIQLIGTINPHNTTLEREYTLYGNKTDGVVLPQFEWEVQYNKDPKFLGYYIAGTDSLLQENQPIFENLCVETRWDYPNWFEIQYRRFSKKIRKIFKFNL